MINFFRKSRKKLADDNRPLKYLRYAIGEIVLVVIGILIALQINNWNEVKKQKHSMRIAIQSLVEDLKLDSIQLNLDLDGINQDMARLDDFKMRLSKPTATIDTVRKIARYEYLPFFNPSNEINRNTILSLLSTGNIDFFEESIKKEILKHNSKQLTLVKIMDENVKIFISVQNTTGIIPQSENPALDMAVIRGPLLDKYWHNIDDVDLLKRTMITISHKKIMQYILKRQKEKLSIETLRMIDLLQTYQDTL